MASRNFLWINKDPSSNSLSNNRTGPLPYSQINKHVQRQTARRKLKRRTVEASAKSLVGWQTHSESADENDESDVATIKREDSSDDLDEAQSSTSSTSPTSPVESYAGSLIKLSSSEQNALQYFLKVWMPSDDFIPQDCQIAGFTPIWPNDGKASSMIVRGALQTDDPVSIYALLTAATRRAQTLNRVQLNASKLPEEFSLKAVQALRRRIELRLPPTQRLILDLSYMVLAELYARSPSRSVIFWKMTRDLIVTAGGLHVIEPFTALAALAYDYFIAMGTVTLPALDAFNDPALLDVDPTLEQVQIYEIIRARQSQLETRVRTITHQNHEFSLVVDALRLLPPSALLEITALVEGNVRKLYPLIAAPFQRAPDSKSRGGNIANIQAADALSIHVRHLTYRIWLWHTASRLASIFSGSDDPLLVVSPPPNVVEEIHKVCTWLDQIQVMLQDSEWSLNLGVTFWMCAICLLVAEREKERDDFRAYLRKLASELHITTPETLSQLLSAHMPLDRTRVDALEVLWAAIQGQARRYSAEAEPG